MRIQKQQDAVVCLECMEDVKGELDEWTHHFCESCQIMKPADKFLMTERQRQCLRKPQCADFNNKKARRIANRNEDHERRIQSTEAPMQRLSKTF